ncbi:MAG: heavy metal translocating P-type ATPase, partial [Pseudomonadota bacterium]
LGEVAQMMAAAENGRSRFVRLADRVAGYYAPAVHLLALIAFAGWMVATAGDWQLSLYTAIAVLIITCPCALGLAVPIVHVIAAGELFARGILVKDGSALERISEIDAVVFDKTGTLTRGQPMVVNSNIADEDVPIAAALALASRHPAAQAITRHFEGVDIQKVRIDDIREVAGAGVEAVWQGRAVRLGRRDWVEQITGVGLEDTDGSDTSLVSFAIADGCISEFQLADVLRPDADYSVRCFAGVHGFDVRILSGDNAEAVAGVANQLDIAHYKSDQRPADKIAELEALSSQGRRVLMIGDGLNDGPALAASHVSMAPSSGSDVGRQAADFVFTTEHLRSAVYAWQVARKASVIAWQNIGLAICYNCVAVPLAIAGFVTPLVAAVAMSASSILVVANSLRLYRFNGLSARARAQWSGTSTNEEDLAIGPEVGLRASV